MRLTPASSLGDYEILDLLGAGGMGEVYRARDTRLGREVALKVLPEDLASRADRLARFEREARTVAALNHPNIVTIHSIEEADGIRFLTMELVEGQPLTSHIAPGGLPLSRVLEISVALCDALAAAQDRGIVHRDLKPGNVMVTRDGHVKVLDFGLAKFMASEATVAKEGGTQEQTASMALTAEGQAMGTSGRSRSSPNWPKRTRSSESFA